MEMVIFGSILLVVSIVIGDKALVFFLLYLLLSFLLDKYIVILFFLFLGINIVYFYKRRSKQQSFSKKIKTTVSSNFKNDKDKKGLFNLFEPVIEKIDLNSDYKLISHANVRLKCIQAGVRTPIKQKSMIFFRYLMICPASLVGAFLGFKFFPADISAQMGSIVVMGLIGFFYPIIRLDSIIQDRQQEISQVFPDFIDLMMVCVEAGMTAEQAYVKIAIEIQEFSEIMAEEIKILSAETTYFLDPKVAYDNFLFRTKNPFVKAFCTVVLQSIQYGTPLASGLRALSTEVRQTQMGDVERKAASLPSKLTVPMMLFTLPVLFTVIAYPAAIQIMEKL